MKSALNRTLSRDTTEETTVYPSSTLTIFCSGSLSFQSTDNLDSPLHLTFGLWLETHTHMGITCRLLQLPGIQTLDLLALSPLSKPFSMSEYTACINWVFSISRTNWPKVFHCVPFFLHLLRWALSLKCSSVMKVGVGDRMLTYSLADGTLRAHRAGVSTLSSLSFFTLGSNHSLGAWWTLESWSTTQKMLWSQVLPIPLDTN